MKKIFTFLVVLVSTLSVFAADFKSDNLWYTITGASTVEVAKHSDHKSLVSVTVPKTVSDGSKVYTVTEIGEEAFAECHTLATVVLPEGVIELGGNAFEACENLVSVSLPEGLQAIGMNAFLSCDHLASVVIPNSVTSVGINAFNGCSALKSVELSENLQEIESGLFNACEALDYIVIPSSVSSIGKNAFYGCVGLDSIKCLGVTPATLANKTNVFKYVGDTIPVYVPCIAGGVSSVDAYNATSWASYFNKIQEPRPIYSVALSVNNDVMGTAKIGERNTECGVEIVAVPNTGYEFVEWADGNKLSTRTLVLESDSAMQAIFKPIRYTITAVSADAAHGKAQGAEGDYNTEVEISATPKFGYRFNYWNDGNQDNPRQVLVLGEATYTAYFKEALVKDTIEVSVCDNTIYVDSITGEDHEIKSATPTSLTWNDSVWGALDQKDTLYTFMVTPLIAPKPLAQADLEAIPGAKPVLVSGYEPDTTASVAAIWNYYKANDDEKTADVVSVKWNYSGKVKCDDTSFAMALIVKDTCGNVLNTACDFVVEPNIVADTVVEESCGEFTWDETGLTYDKSGIYTHTVKSDAGCDSVYHVLDLKVWGPDTTVINDTVCYGTVVNGEKLTEDKVIEEASGKTIHGCDSMTVYKFTVLPVIPVDTTKVTICAGESYTWPVDSKTYTTKTSIFVTKKTINGCDSTLALELTVLEAVKDSVIRDTLCYGATYTWTKVGKKYTGAGEFIKDSTTYQSGDCYGKLYLELTCWPEVVNVVTDTTICCGDSIKWNGRVYYEEGTYTIDTFSVSGCDSVATLKLTVLSKIAPTIIDTTICAGGEYYWNLTQKTYSSTTTDSVVLQHGKYGCDSLVVLNLTVLDRIPSTVIDTTICSGDTYEFYGTIYDKPTRVSYQDKSVVSGCDSVVILDLKYHPAIADTVTVVTLCAGEHFTWTANDSTYTASAQEKVILESIHGCDSVAILDLTILDTIPTIFRYDTICYGDTLLWEEAGKQLTESCIVQDTLTSISGCDSVVVLNLTVLSKIEPTIIDTTICAGGEYYWNLTQKTYSSTTTDSVVLQHGKYGCDSLVVLNLTVLDRIPSTVIDTTICSGDTYEFYGTIYDKPTRVSYQDKSVVSGCDSVVILDLKYHPAIADTVTVVTLCAGEHFTWTANDSTYTASAQEKVILESIHGCDSVAILDLTILDTIPTIFRYDTICYGDTLLWEEAGKQLTESCIVQDTLTSISGCDSVVVLNLTVLSKIEPTIIDTTICAGGEYYWNLTQKTYSSTTTDSVVLQHGKYGCDSLVVLNLTVLDRIPSTVIDTTICSGDTYEFYGTIYDKPTRVSYQDKSVVSGCDSVVILDLKYHPAIADTVTVVTLCAGEHFTWTANDSTYTASAQEKVILESIHGCDSVAILDLTILDTIPTTFRYDTICYGDTLLWEEAGKQLTESCIAHDTLTSITGCDSVVVLNLTILPKIDTTFIDTAICHGKYYYWSATETQYFESFSDTVVLSSTKYGCDSVVALNLHVWPEIKDTIVTDTICYGDFYVFGGDTLKINSNLTKTLPSVNGCDSTVHLQLTVLDSIPVTYETAYICFGKEPYFWEAKNKNYYSATTDTVVLPSVLTGCDSTVVLTVIAVEELKTTVTDTICFGDSIEWGGRYYKKNGLYDMTLQSAISGCDSVVTLNLTVLDKIEPVVTEDTICACNAPYIWRNQVLSESGVYNDIVKTKYGCDSIYTLNLHVWPLIKDTIVTDTICYGDFYVFGGDTLREDVTNRTRKFPSIHGCDSIVTLNLTVLDPIPVTYETAYLCYGKEPFLWDANKTEYNSSTIDTAVVPSVLTGCDSVIVLTVIAVEELKTTVTDTICFGDSIEWGGYYYKKNGLYDMTLQSAISGCDSVVTLNLTVLDKIEPVVTEDTICACNAPYIWRNQVLSESGVYNDIVKTKYGCDSIYTLNLHVWPLIKDTIVTDTICYGDFYVFGGDTLREDVTNRTRKFPSIHGCDSIVTLNLTVLDPIPVTHETAYICFGKEPFFWEAKNKTYYSATTDTVVLPSVLTGCDSTVVLTLIEVPELKSTVDSTICFGDSIEWGGRYYKKNGLYDMTLQSAISGCDSVVTLNLTIRPMIEPTYTPDTICEGDVYTWHGQSYNATGEYSYTHTSIHGCDSVEILQLFVRPVVETVTKAEICSGEVYRWEGKDYTSSTNMSITYDSKITGCDSIVTLHLIVHNEIPVTVLDTAICHGTSINWLGTSYANDTIVTDTLICKHGCDSVVMLKLHIRDSIHTMVYDTICHGGSYEWNGKTYNDSITEQITLTDIYGCDSIVTLHLTVLDSILPTEDTQVACDSYEWHGDIYTASGDYTKTLTTRHGCDSVVTLHLTVKYSSYTDTAAVECDSFYWHNTGETYTESGDYTYTTVAANGCDSIVTLHLTIKKSTVGEAEQLIICYGDSIEWNGQVYKVEGDYSTILENANAVGCDSTAKMHLTILPDVQYEYYKATICANETHDWFNRQLSKAGTYYDTIYNIRECDSIIHVLDLTVLPIDTITKTVTACDSYTWNEETYTVSGEYHHTTSSLVDGCDSVTILFLTITPTIYKDTTIAACISYEWNGVVYKESGDYTTTFTAASGCDSVVTMHLTINQPTVGDPRKEYICDGESYEWHGTTYSESGYYSIILENAVGCDSTAYLDLTVLPEMKYKSHTLFVCASELPYEWNNLSLTESGEYTYREQFAANASCDSIEHVLTFTVYDMSLPDTISQPIAICGKPIDLMKATDQIESYIASISHYAPNATVVWQEWIDGVWVDYDYETLKGSQSEIIIRYAIITDCGVIYSDEMVLVVEQATPENSTELDNMSVESKYGNRIFLFDLNAFSSTFGWTPTPEQVSWYKVVGEVDVYGEMGDDELVGVGHSYNLPEGEVMVGGYYAIVEQHAVSVDDCETIYRSTVIYATASGIAPKLVPNVVYPDEVLTIKNLDASQIHQILVYGASGELIATYKADKVGEFMFNAANATGYYLVDIINTNGSTTLRYVVK